MSDIAQKVEHLTREKSRSLGLNPGLVCYHFFFIPLHLVECKPLKLTATNRLTPARGRNPGMLIYKSELSEDHLKGKEYVGLTSWNASGMHVAHY